ncbi:hypothetical protein ACSQ67_009100 [Phaseolus vulgaris]
MKMISMLSPVLEVGLVKDIVESGVMRMRSKWLLSILVDMGWKLRTFVKPSLILFNFKHGMQHQTRGCNIKHRIKFNTNLLSPSWFPPMSGITSVAPRLLATIIGYYQQTQSEIEKLGLLRKIKKGEGKLTREYNRSIALARSITLAPLLSLHRSRSVVLTPSLNRTRSNAHDPLLNHVHGHVQSRTKCSNAPLLSCSNA